MDRNGFQLSFFIKIAKNAALRMSRGPRFLTFFNHPTRPNSLGRTMEMLGI